MTADIRVHPKGGPNLRIWAPLFLLWLLAAPIALLLAPLFAVVCLVKGLNPLRAACALLAVLGSLSGLLVQVESPDAQVLIRVR